MSYLIYIGDPSLQGAQLLETMLKDAGFYTRTFNGLGELLDRSTKTLPDVQVLHPGLLLEGRLPRNIFSRVPTLVYGENFNPDQMETLYRFGVKRVISGNDDEDVMIRVVATTKMMLYRQNELRRVQREYLTHGSLETFSLEEVLQNALLEKKNLKIKIKNGSENAKLRTYQGHLISAFSGNLTGEDAVLKTLQMREGAFVIRAYQKDEEYAPISASTLALLAEAQHTETLINRFCKKIGADNPELKLVSSKQGLKVSRPEARLLQAVRTYKTLRDVLVHSPMSARKSLATLEKFHLAGILRYAGESKQIQPPPRRFKPEEIAFIRESLMPQGAKQGTLAILGLPSSGRNELVRTIAGNQQTTVKTMQSLDFTRVSLGSNLSMVILGASIEESFLSVLDRLSQSLIGCVLLLDNRQPDKFEFINYLFKRLVQIYPIPYVVGLTHSQDTKNDVIGLRQRFSVPDGVDVLPVVPDSFDSFIELMYQLKQAEQNMAKEAKRA
ncbi:MAG: DUF4388 domain-containing protein [Calditrichia bacterium]